MATYTDTDKLRTDTFIVSDDEITERVLTRAGVMSYNVVNAKLDGIYAVPFAATFPPIIVDISDMLTRAFARMFQAVHTGGKLKKGDKQSNEGQLALSMLDDIASGAMSIPGLSRASARKAAHNLDGYTRIFDIDNPLNHMPDSDLLDAIADERK